MADVCFPGKYQPSLFQPGTGWSSGDPDVGAVHVDGVHPAFVAVRRRGLQGVRDGQRRFHRRVGVHADCAGGGPLPGHLGPDAPSHGGRLREVGRPMDRHQRPLYLAARDPHGRPRSRQLLRQRYSHGGLQFQKLISSILAYLWSLSWNDSLNFRNYG